MLFRSLNLNLVSIIDLSAATNSLVWMMDGQPYHFRRGYVEQMDQQVKTLSDAGVVVTLILLDYKSDDPALDAIMLHPKFSPAAPHRLSAFNTSTADGLRHFKACLEFLAERYARPDRSCGRAVNFIIGNEVNSHWEWYNMGRAPMETVAEGYLRTVRVAHTAVRKFSATAVEVLKALNR